MSIGQSARVGQGVDRVHVLVSPNGFDARKTESQTALVSGARLDRVKRDLQNDVRCLRLLRSFGDLRIVQTSLGFSNGRQLAGRFVAHREGVIAQDVIALAVAELRRHHHDVECRQFLL